MNAAAVTTSPDRAFTEDQHAIWATLYARQASQISQFACREYLDGFDILQLPDDRIPTLEELNAVITPRTGWKMVHTSVRYSDATDWYRHFARREFLITDYMRSWDELEFTPEPDMFHDIFGHLPFFTLPEYAAFQDLFAPAFNRANADQRENIKRLAWYSTEFGLIREQGDLKIFGTGLISSSGEMAHALAGKTPIQEFTVENVLGHDKVIWSFNSALFVADSLDAFRREVMRYIETI